MFYNDFQDTFRPAWNKWVDDQIATVASISSDSDITTILSYTKDILHGKGKHVRPALIYLFTSTLSPTQPIDLRPGFFIEAFHLFALIHDDVMDKGTARRNVPTIHTRLLAQYQNEQRRGDLPHIANAQAILAGDLVLNWTMSLLLELSKEPYGTQLSQLMFSMINQTMIGQMIDVNMMSQRHTTDRLLQEKMDLKTARYTFITPMQTGAIVAGHGDAIMMETCKHIGEPLGFGFQIQDDLLDLLQDTETTGKSGFADLLYGQQTPITHYIKSKGSDAEKKLLEETIKSGEIDVKAFRKMLHDSGAVDYCQTQITAYFERSKKAIEKNTLPDATKEGLFELLTYLENRAA